jgi:hypothetical protein
MSDWDNSRVRAAMKEDMEKLKNPNREYVIVCNRHKGIAGALLFWGIKTKDEQQQRSFGGYTSDLNGCERYTKDELNTSSLNDFPIYGEDFNPDKWRKQGDFAIRIEQLKELGYRPMLIYYR